ncbi:MAG: UvrD-helicase domain-containing protein, partial [Holdemania filiformis]
MAIQWSEEQLKAIHTTDHNILVSASAGAGKTTVLVARLMKRMLEDHISIDRIVAMTFTEAAASEMKKRLLQSLNDKLQEPDLDEAEAQYCRQQLILLQSAHISTIHSFCLSIIKADYALIGLNPSRIQHIFDDAALAQMKDQAFTQACRRQMAHDPDSFTTLLQTFSSRSEDVSELKKAVLSIAAKASGAQDPQAWI